MSMEEIPKVLYETQDGGLPLSDSEYAEEFQLQEALEASFSALQISQCGESSRTYCEICTEGKESNEMFKIESCSHSFCSDCIAKHIQTKIQDNIHDITCPNCSSFILPFSCRHIIPEDIFARWEEAWIQATVPFSQKFHCPYDNCSAFFINDEDQEIIRQSECLVCRRLFCAQCKVPWHAGSTCEEFQKFQQDHRENNETGLQKLVRENNWKNCPNCNVVIDKTEGCIHMTCRCGFEFCYICGLDWNEAHWRCQEDGEE